MPKVRPITIDELDHLGLDDQNRLYWKGTPVVVEEKLKLQWWLNVSAIAGASSGVLLAVIELLRFIHE